MNFSRLHALTTGPMRLWHRFHIWRAMRMYRRVALILPEAEALKAKADALMRKHAEDPQAPLPLFPDDEEK